MAELTLATAKAGEVVTMANGKRVISDGRGGGKRAPTQVKKPVTPTPAVVSNTSTTRSLAAQPAAPSVAQPVQGRTTTTQQPNTVQTGLRKLANQGNTLSDLVKQNQGRPR